MDAEWIKAVNDMLAERERQESLTFDNKPTDDFDRANTKNDWVAFICAYAGRASDKVARNQREGQGFRESMIKVAALALAAIEAHDKGWC